MLRKANHLPWYLAILIFFYLTCPLAGHAGTPPYQDQIQTIRNAYETGNFSRCIVLCEDLLSLKPTHPEALFLRGKASLKLYANSGGGNNLQTAMESAEKLINQNGSQEAGHLLRGDVYQSVKLYPMAIIEYRSTAHLKGPLMKEAKGELKKITRAWRYQFKLIDEFYRDPYRIKVYQTRQKRLLGKAGKLEHPRYYFVFFHYQTYVQHYEILEEKSSLTRALEYNLTSPLPQELESLKDLAFYYEVKQRLISSHLAKSSFEHATALLKLLPPTLTSKDIQQITPVLAELEKAAADDPTETVYTLSLMDAFGKATYGELQLPEGRQTIFFKWLRAAEALQSRNDSDLNIQQLIQEKTAYLFYNLHAIPLCLGVLNKASRSSFIQDLQQALNQAGYASLEKLNSIEGPGNLLIDCYRIDGKAADSNGLSEELLWLVHSTQDYAMLAVYTLASQQIKNQARYMLVEHLYGVDRTVITFENGKPLPNDLQKQVSAQALAKLPPVWAKFRRSELIRSIQSNLDSLKFGLAEMKTDRSLV